MNWLKKLIGWELKIVKTEVRKITIEPFPKNDKSHVFPEDYPILHRIEIA